MEITKIYKVISYNQYNQSEDETEWHTSKKYCEEWIDNCSYKASCQIKSEKLIIDND